jgi:hypothetical protein
MAVYREGVFNNIFESASVCFPVCQATLGKNDWRNIVKKFVSNHHASSPLFRNIPHELVKFLEDDSKIPDYIKQLAHYEWVELAVSALQTKATAKKTILSETTDLLNEIPVLTPAHMLLQYDYPVQKISAQFKPEQTESTYLLVFRNELFDVNFVELNPMTYALLHTVLQGMSGKQALTYLAKQIQHPNPETIIEFGHGVLKDLVQQQAIIGSR